MGGKQSKSKPRRGFTRNGQVHSVHRLMRSGSSLSLGDPVPQEEPGDAGDADPDDPWRMRTRSNSCVERTTMVKETVLLNFGWTDSLQGSNAISTTIEQANAVYLEENHNDGINEDHLTFSQEHEEDTDGYEGYDSTEYNQGVVTEEMVKIFEPLIVKNLIVREILPYLPFIEDHCYIYSAGERNPRNGVTKMLEEIRTSPVVGKWSKFIDALDKCGYQYISQNIRGYRLINTVYQTEYLKTLTPKFSKVLSVREIIPNLCAKLLISDCDREEILKKDTNEGNIAATILMLDRVTRKLTHWYREFIYVLKETGNVELAEDLEIDEIMNKRTEWIESGKRQSIQNNRRPLPKIPNIRKRAQEEQASQAIVLQDSPPPGRTRPLRLGPLPSLPPKQETARSDYVYIDYEAPPRNTRHIKSQNTQPKPPQTSSAYEDGEIYEDSEIYEDGKVYEDGELYAEMTNTLRTKPQPAHWSVTSSEEEYEQINERIKGDNHANGDIFSSATVSAQDVLEITCQDESNNLLLEEARQVHTELVILEEKLRICIELKKVLTRKQYLSRTISKEEEDICRLRHGRTANEEDEKCQKYSQPKCDLAYSAKTTIYVPAESCYEPFEHVLPRMSNEARVFDVNRAGFVGTNVSRSISDKGFYSDYSNTYIYP